MHVPLNVTIREAGITVEVPAAYQVTKHNLMSVNQSLIDIMSLYVKDII